MKKEVLKTMICPKCGNNAPDGSNFCPRCRADLREAARPVDTRGGYPGGYSGGGNGRNRGGSRAVLYMLAGALVVLALVLAIYLILHLTSKKAHISS